MARLTPYELVFGAPAFEERIFPEIREEAEARAVDTSLPTRFLLLGTVGRLLRELAPEEAEQPGADLEESRSQPGGPTGERLERLGMLLFQAYHFWLFERYLLVAEEALVRRLAEDSPRVGDWALIPPYPAGYFQLPRHLFWARVDEERPPEPVDGLFWTMIGAEDPAVPPFRRVDLLLALGLRPDRPGLSVIDVGAELRGEPPGHWADADARPDGPDFANILPGGDHRALHALVTPAETLKLFSLLCHHIAANPDAVGEPERAPAGATPPTPHALPPSSLAFRRIRLAGDGNG